MSDATVKLALAKAAADKALDVLLLMPKFAEQDLERNIHSLLCRAARPDRALMQQPRLD